MCQAQQPDPYLQDQDRTCSFKGNIVFLRVYVVSGL
jgi:hypothetical protein